LNQRNLVILFYILIISCCSVQAQTDTGHSPKQDNSICINPEIQAAYPGGEGFWILYLHKHLEYPEEAENKHIEGWVRVQFIVEPDSRINSFTALSGPKELYEEAIRLCKNSGIWVPAVQNGKKVRSRVIMPIEFKL
jgi:periplasmic protein TonB